MNNIIVKQLNKLIYPIVIADVFNKFVWGNKKFYSVHAEMFLTDSTTSIDQALIDEIVSSKEYTVSCDNKVVTYEIIKSQIEIESKKYFLFSFFNISKRKELATRLYEKQILFETLSENLPEGIVVHSQELIEYTNPTFERLCGLNSKQLKNKKFIDIFPLKEKSYIINLFQKLALQEIKKFNIETKISIKKKKDIWVSIKTKTLTQWDEFYFLTIVTDISKEKSDNEKLAQLAYFDGLTGIYNRRKFDEILKIETNRVHRYQRKLSALFFDIDHFKKVNDTYGHDIGDDVLQKMAEIIKSHIRDTDYFARWGGEEFILLLPETDVDEAKVISENIRKVIAINDFNKVGNITISIGVSELKEEERSSTFLKRLDMALYQAKGDGRNRTVVF